MRAVRLAPAVVSLVVLLSLASTALARATAAPVLARSVVVLRVSGVVLLEPRGSHVFSSLGGAAQSIPVGSTVDATRGKVELVTAAATRGKTQRGFFDGGAFVVTQARSGLTALALTGGRPRGAACGGRRAAGRAAALSPGVMRLLHGSAHGRFTTRGRYAAATVRGTQWATSDTCQGTTISDASGRVATRTTNGSLTNSLRPGQRVLYRCAARGQGSLSRSYCILVLLTDLTSVIGGRRVHSFHFSTGLATKSPDTTARLCIDGPKRLFCTPYPLFTARSGFKIALALCLPNQGPGNYSVTWEVRSIALGAPLSFRAPVGAVFTPCRTFQGNPLVGTSPGTLASGAEIVNRYSLPSLAHGLDIRIFLRPTATTGQQVLRGLVYSDLDGAPGALVGVTAELTYRSIEGPGWYALFFPRHPTPANPSGLLQLPAGEYWIGVIAGDDAGVAGTTYDAVPGADRHGMNPFAAGPSDPFEPSAVGNERLSLYLDYYAPPF